MSHPFTGQSSLTGFAFLLSDLLWQNETDHRDPYRMSPPASSTSGYAFGAIQWDVPNHRALDFPGLPAPHPRNAEEILRDILLNARDASGSLFFSVTTVDSIVKFEEDASGNIINRTGLAYTKGNSHALDAYIGLINAALDSAYGRATIDADHATTIGAYNTWINDSITLVQNPDDHAFLTNSNIAKLFIGDFRNQFSGSANNLLRGFLQGQAAYGVTKQGTLGVDDLLNFYFRTPHASRLPHDPVRRFANVVEVAGGYAPTDLEEAKGVLQAYTFFVMPRKTAISSANTGALSEFLTRVITPAKAPVIQAGKRCQEPFCECMRRVA
ncbi:MAG: hypothetical protein OEV08_10085 [Nitrospira sp.]|nr:hypothetical protein [Nitrospira sp.]